MRNKAVYIALGILPDGNKEILGIWIEQTEGAKFWLRVMNELKNRGVGGGASLRQVCSSSRSSCGRRPVSGPV